MAHDDDDLLSGPVPDPDVEPTAGERSRAKSFGELIDKAIKFVQKWVGAAVEAVTAAFMAIAKDGFFKYVKQLFGEKINAISSDLWEIVEPLFDALADSEDILGNTLSGLFDEKFPSSLSEILEWCFRIMAKLYGGAWGLGPWQFHPLSLLFIASGSMMISKTLRIPKP